MECPPFDPEIAFFHDDFLPPKVGEIFEDSPVSILNAPDLTKPNFFRKTIRLVRAKIGVKELRLVSEVNGGQVSFKVHEIDIWPHEVTVHELGGEACFNEKKAIQKFHQLVNKKFPVVNFRNKQFQTCVSLI